MTNEDFEKALDAILKAASLVEAKEIAAEALEVDVEDYLVEDVIDYMDAPWDMDDEDIVVNE